MSTLLIIPAAGTGSRLRAAVPKALVPVAGRPMLDHLLALYQDSVDCVVVIVNPSAMKAVEGHLAGRPGVELAIQPQPTGMLDAILLASAAVESRRPSSVWITWCDQIAVHPRTVERLSQLVEQHRHPAVVMPTVRGPDPYIHLQRDDTGRIVRILQRREGDTLPATGESDTGLFALSLRSYRELLPEYARAAATGGRTGERNFLPFVPWVAGRADVVTFPSTTAEEAIGINTPEELRRLEEYLKRARI